MACALCAFAHPRAARAEGPVTRRPVAVIDLTLGGDPRVVELARELFAALTIHGELEPLAMVSLADANALIGTPPDDDAPRIATALANLRAAEEQVAKFQPGAAVASARAGMAGLEEVTPSAAAPIYAQLAFAYGQGALGTHQPAEAAWAFSLVRAITPERALDPNQYFPEVLEAFAAAKPTGTGTIDVRGVGEIWIDGTAYASAPRAIPIGRGRHLVQLTGVDRLTRGAVVDVEAGRTVLAEIAPAPATDELRIRRARVVLAHAAGGVERASAMSQLAKLVHVGDAILLSQVDGKLMVQTWRDRAPGFTAIQERDGRPADTLLEPLAPTPLPTPPRPTVIPLPPEVPAWYRDRRLQVGTAVVVVVAVVAAIAWASGGAQWQPPSNDIVFAGRSR